jgi:twitching motility protein PilT
LEELGLPATLYHFCELRDGLVIVAGPAGSGKTTTMGTLIDRINHKRKVRVITIEDPVEYIHEPAMGVVDQRQVGMDAPSFNDALVCALRQDPDVIYFGESRDRDTIRTAMTAAETGHLVFTTVHAGDAVGAIERLVMTFSMEEQPSVRQQLAMVLRAVVVQHLLHAAGSRESAEPDRSDGRPAPKRRLPACEILINTPAIAHCIASGQGRQIASFMEAGRSFGMQKLEHDVTRLLAAQKISSATAAMAILERSDNPVA